MFSKRYQEGCVLRQGKNKQTWVGKWREDELTPEGKIVRIQRKLKLGSIQELPTKADARRQLRLLMGDSTKKPAMRLTFPELVKRWQEVVGPALKESTREHYKNALKNVGPTFQSLAIRDIDRYTVEKFLIDRSQRYSRSTLRSLRTSLSLVLGWAMANGWIDKNPVRGIRLPQTCGGRTVERHCLTRADAIRLSEAMPEPVSTLVLLLYATGLRIGEACALRWSDLSADVLHVQRRLYGGKVDTVKSKSGNRKLPLSPDLINRLEQLRKDGSWIFQATNGSPLTPGNVRTRQLAPTAKKLGIEISGLHDFRHTVSQALRRQGTHPKVVAAVLGHSKVNLSMDVYDHVDRSDLQPALDGLAVGLVPDGTRSEHVA